MSSPTWARSADSAATLDSPCRVDSPPATGANGGVNGVNANGEIVGWYVTSDSFTHAFSSTLDDPGNLVDLGTLGGTYSVALGVNSQGEIVGQSTITPDDLALHAFLYDGGAMVDLNTLLVAAGSGWSLLDATSINDQGWIVGNGIDPAGQSQGFLLTPLPVAEPLSLVLLGTGGVCLAALVRRWRKSRKALCPSSSRASALSDSPALGRKRCFVGC